MIDFYFKNRILAQNNQDSDSNINVLEEYSNVELATQGIFYKDTKSIPIRKLDFTDEVLLSNKDNYLDDVYIRLLKNTISKESKIQAEDLLVIDKDILLIWLRLTAWGNEYGLNIPCPKCNKNNKTVWDLLNTSVIYPDSEEYKEVKENGYVKYDLDENSDKVIGISLPTIKQLNDNDKFFKVIETETKMNYDIIKYLVAHILFIKDGENLITTCEEIYLWLLNNKLSMKHSKEIREIAKKIQIKLSNSQDYICKHNAVNELGEELKTSEDKAIKCGYVEKNIEIPMSDNFFQPKRE